MDFLETITEIKDRPNVQEGLNLLEEVNKKLVLGQTKYMCKHGTLSDGHDYYSNAQRYFQAIREAYRVSTNIHESYCAAMEAQANRIDAQEAWNVAKTPQECLRAEAKFKRAEAQLKELTLNVQNRIKMLEAYQEVIHELGPEMDERYPEGIEQAQEDLWSDLFVGKMLKDPKARIDNIPLDPVTKAKLGLKWNRWDSAAQLVVQKLERGEIKDLTFATEKQIAGDLAKELISNDTKSDNHSLLGHG